MRLLANVSGEQVAGHHTCRSLDTSRLSERHSDVLCLATIDGIGRNRVAKQLSLRTTTSLSSNAVIALLACRIERDHDLVAFVEALDFIAFLDDLADKLMAAYEVWRAFQVASVEMQVRTLATRKFRPA